MIRKFKKDLILSSALTLLPMLVGALLWNKLPEQMAIHYGFDGTADGFGSLAFVVFGMPPLLLAMQWLGLFLTAKDPKNQGQNPKPLRLALWIMPITANLVCGMLYAIALGRMENPLWIMQLMMGVMFIAIGNYLPKCRQNYTMGIKISWTLEDEENWNATHRFGGKVWTVGGIVILLSILLPRGAGSAVMFVSIVALTGIPIVYSYLFYRRKKANGENPAVTRTPMTKGMKRASGIASVFVAALLIFVAVMMFTGDLTYQFGDTALTVKASYYDDLTLPYDAIDSMDYRPGDPGGVRNFGWGSFRLQMGAFQNDAFGPYTRYTYFRPAACVMIQSGSKTLVLSAKTEAETKELYEQLLARTDLQS